MKGLAAQAIHALFLQRTTASASATIAGKYPMQYTLHQLVSKKKIPGRTAHMHSDGNAMGVFLFNTML